MKTNLSFHRNSAFLINSTFDQTLAKFEAMKTKFGDTTGATGRIINLKIPKFLYQQPMKHEA